MQMTDKVHVADGVARIIVSNPQRGCSLDGDSVAEGAELLRSGADVRAIVLTGPDGTHFCSGGDVKGFAAAPNPGAHVKSLADALHELLLRLSESPAPVISAVRGWAAGAGFGIALTGDIVIGGPSTKFRAAYTAIGYSPDGGLSWLLPRAVGRVRGADIILSNLVVEAQEAERIGILSRLVESDDDVVPAAMRLAAELANGPDGSYAAIKRLLSASPGATFAAQLETEAAAIAERADSAQGREGAAAFVERRTPDFRGA
jgi:2-(1,2-epoxy-1,2-dihydrophenyl)acetyl-CoA isomerase